MKLFLATLAAVAFATSASAMVSGESTLSPRALGESINMAFTGDQASPTTISRSPFIITNLSARDQAEALTHMSGYTLAPAGPNAFPNRR